MEKKLSECIFFNAEKGYPRNRVAEMAGIEDENESQKYQKTKKIKSGSLTIKPHTVIRRWINKSF